MRHPDCCLVSKWDVRTRVNIATFLVTSPIVINVPTRGLLAVETMHAIVQWLENLNIKRNMTSMFVNKKHHYMLHYFLLFYSVLHCTDGKRIPLPLCDPFHVPNICYILWENLLVYDYMNWVMRSQSGCGNSLWQECAQFPEFSYDQSV